VRSPSKATWGVVISVLFAIVVETGLPFSVSGEWLHAFRVCAATALLLAVIGWALVHVQRLHWLRAREGMHPMIILVVGVIGAGLAIGLYLLTRPADEPAERATPRVTIEQATATRGTMLVNLSQTSNELAARPIWEAAVTVNAVAEAKDVGAHMLVYDGERLLRSVVAFWESLPPVSGSDAGPRFAEQSSFRIGQRRRLLVAFKWEEDEEAYCHSQQTAEVYMGRIPGLAIPRGELRIVVELRSADGVNQDFELRLTNRGRNAGLDLRVASQTTAAGTEPTRERAAGAITLENLFKTDFPHLLKGYQQVRVDGDQVLGQAYLDFAAGVKFIGFYIPRQRQTFDVIKALAGAHDMLWQNLFTAIQVEAGQVGQQQRTRAGELRPSSRV
jgi:hypothetical protein